MQHVRRITHGSIHCRIGGLGDDAARIFLWQNMSIKGSLVAYSNQVNV